MNDKNQILSVLMVLPAALAFAGVLFQIRGQVLQRLALALVALLLVAIGAGLLSELLADSNGLATRRWVGVHFSSFWSQNFEFRIDLFSLAQGFFSVWTFLAAFFVDQEGWSGHRSKLSAALLLLVGVLGAVFSGNLLTFAAMSTLSLIPATLLVGWDGSEDSGLFAQRFGMLGFGGGTLLVITYLGLHPAVKPEEFQILGSFGLKDVLFLMFGVAMLARAPLVPFHAAQWTLLRMKHLAHVIPLLLAWNIGLFGFFRFGPELFPVQMVKFSGALAGLAATSLFVSALLVLRQGRNRQFVYGLHLFLVSAALLGFSALNRLGWMGAWLVLWLSGMTACVAWCLLVVWERRGIDFRLSHLAGAPMFGAVSAYTTAALVGLPVSLLFFSLMFTFVGASEAFRWMYLMVAAAVPLILVAAVRRLFFAQANQKEQSRTGGEFPDLSRSEQLAIFPMVIFLILSMLFINPISARMSGASGAALKAAGWEAE